MVGVNVGYEYAGELIDIDMLRDVGNQPFALDPDAGVDQHRVVPAVYQVDVTIVAVG